MGANTNVVYINRIAFIITTKCTLSCSHCLHLNSRYVSRAVFEKDKLLNDVGRLMAAVDTVGGVHVMGGEALLHPELPGIISALLQEEKIGHVGLTTNGTVLPDESLLAALKHPKAEVYLSGYSTVPNTGKWIDILRQSGVSYHTGAAKKWVDAGGIELRNRKADELKSMYSQCLYRECVTLLDGRLFVCPRNANAVNQGVIPFDLSGGVDLRKEKINTLRDEISHMLFDTEYLACCDRCDYILPSGEQRQISRAT